MTRIVRAVGIIVLGTVVAAGAACSEKADSKPVESGPPPVAVTVDTVAQANLQESVDVVGTLEAKFAADVKSEVTGVVTEVFVTEWVPVKRGAPLARLDTRETEAGIETLKAAEAQARVGLNRAKREYERSQQLKQFGLITPQAEDDAQTAVESAEAAVTSARAQIKSAETHLAKSQILSPMDGVVALRGVSVGDRVENMGGNSAMFRIVDNRVLDLTVAVPSSRLATVRAGQTLEFTTETIPGRSFTGQVKFINPELDPANRSARIVVEIPNPDGQLKSGAFVQGRIVTGQRAGVLQVRKEALVNWNLDTRQAEVFLVVGDRAEKRAVTTGTGNGVSVEVLSGVKAGDQVVTRGGYALKGGDRVVVSKGEGA